jgi:hypothetical protein
MNVNIAMAKILLASGFLTIVVRCIWSAAVEHHDAQIVGIRSTGLSHPGEGTARAQSIGR